LFARRQKRSTRHHEASLRDFDLFSELRLMLGRTPGSLRLTFLNLGA